LSARRSAIPGLVRSDLRTALDRRPPRRHWLFAVPRLALWQLTTRPPRRGRSGGQLPVETGNTLPVRAGRTAVLRRSANVVCE
jgi:hypothetical protein